MTFLRRLISIAALAVAAAGCQHEIRGPQPTAGAVAPLAACAEQIATRIDLSGTGLSPLPTRTVEGKLETDLPQIRLVEVMDLTGAAASSSVLVPDDPRNPAASDVTWTDQDHMSFTVCPTGVCSAAAPPRTDYDAPPGLYSIAVTNRNSRTTTLASALTLVPRPSLTAIAPDLLCQDEDSALTLTGDFFIQVDGQPGSVSIGDKLTLQPTLSDCRPLPSNPAIKIEACKTATVVVPAKSVATGKVAVVLTNPAPVGCRSTEVQTLTFVPEPKVTDVQPDLECFDEGEETLVVTGAGFLSFDGMLPAVVVDAAHAFPAANLDGCTAVDGPKEKVLSCTSLTFTLPKGAVPPGGYDLKVRNPAPADCISTTSARLAVVPAPTLAAVAPDLACDAQGTVAVNLTGTGFLQVGSALPTVKIGSFTAPATAANPPCAEIAGLKEAVKACSGLSVTLPEGALPPGSYPVTVTNPETAACSTKQAVSFLVVPPPTLASINPPALCTTAQDNPVTLTGAGFLGIGAALPTVTIGGASFPAASLAGCTPVTGAGETVESCTQLTAVIAKGGLTMSGALPVTVKNPAPAGCSSGSVLFMNLPPPTVTGASPAQICRGGGEVDVAGTGFTAGMSAALGGLAAATTAVAAPTLAKATFGLGLAPNAPARYPLSVTVPGNCTATLPAAVSVVSGPILFFADPPVVYSGIRTTVTLYGSGLTKPIARVSLVPSGGSGATDLALLDPNAARPQATVPAGMAAGDYDVVVLDSGSCPAGAVLPKGVRVVGALDLTLTSMTPRFGGTTLNTPSTIKGAGFAATPRAYLSLQGGSGAATALRSTAFLDGSTLTTVVKAGLPVGTYDLTVVNPDDKVGFLSSAFQVTAAPPPVVEDVSPGSVPKNGAPEVTLTGESFAPGAAASLECVDAAGASAGGPVAAPAASTASCPSATSTCIGIGVPVGSLGTAQACVVRVTNPDGAFGEFSSLTLTNPSANLGALQAGTDLHVARRALGAVAARGNAASRFLYAIGGDGGAPGSALDSVEVATVDLFGKLGAWTVLPLKLPARTTYVSAVAHGRYIYLVGGHDGTKAVSAVYRARVLDPLDLPEITDADIDTGAAGLGGGTWTYRVSAVMPAGDPENPGGETLVSDPFVVTLPDLADKLQVTLTWKPFAGAAGYRVYRSPVAAEPLGSEQLIGTAGSGATVTFTDTGLPPQAGEGPLPVGSTTKWVAIAPLLTPRAGAGVTKLLDPTDPGKLYLYAVGGLDAGGAALASTEHLVVAISGASQTPAPSWTADPAALAAGRWQLGAFAASNDNSSSVPAGSAFIYAAGGLASGGGLVTDVDAFAVTLPGGALGARSAVKAMSSGGAAGYGSVIANDFLYVFGGSGGAPSSSASSAFICAGSGAACSGPAPTLEKNAWNSLGGISLTPGRYLMGSTLESSFIYLVAGATSGPDSASTSTVFTIW